LVDTFVRNNLYIDFIFKFNQLTALYYYKAKQKFPERPRFKILVSLLNLEISEKAI
jgi:hypothetical protein